MRRMIYAALIPLLLAVFLASGPAVTSTQAQGDVEIGLVTINLQARFFNRINKGAEDAASEEGVDLTIADGRNDPSRQVSAIENFIVQGKDAIIVLAIDVEGIKPVLRDARDEGIPVVAIDAEVDVPPANMFIGVDNYGAGLQAGSYAAGYVDGTMPDETVEVGIVGALNSYIQNLRKDGFASVLEDLPNIEVVNVVDGQNVQETALNAAENLVTGNPNLDIIYATGEPALNGAIAAVESQGVEDRVTVMGWDLSQQIIRGIDNGIVQAVIQQHPYQEGYKAVKNSIKLVNGEEVPQEILIPVTVVNETNVDDFRSLFQ